MRTSDAPHPYLILFALWLMMFSASSQLIVVVPLLPEIGEALHVGTFWRGLLLTAYSVALGGSALATGPVSDRVGRRLVLLVGASLMSVTLALHGVTDSYALFLGMRLLAGIGGGMLSGGTVAYVGDYFPYERRGWANGWVMSGNAFGQVAGVPIGKVLGTSLDYRAPFLLFAVTMAAAAVLIWRVVPQPDVELDDRPLTPDNVVRKYRRVLGSREVVAAIGAYFLMFCGFGLFASFLPTWLEGTVGVTSYEVAVLFGIGGLANVVVAPMAGSLSDRVGRKPLIIASTGSLGVVMAVAPYLIGGFVTAAVLFFGAMALNGMRISPLQSLLTALAPTSRLGMLTGLAMSIGQAGFGIGSFLASTTYGAYGYPSNTAAGALAMVAMALLVWRGIPEPRLDPAGSQEAEPEAERQ